MERIEEKAFIVNKKDSPWEHFFLSLENKDPKDWGIFYFQDHNWKIFNSLDSIPNDYQRTKYFTKEDRYYVSLKKRLIVNGRPDLFNKKVQNSDRNGFASANIVYVLKRQQEQTIERFRGKRIKELYQEIAGLNYNENNHK